MMIVFHLDGDCLIDRNRQENWRSESSQIRKRFFSLLAVPRSHALNGLRIPANETRETLCDSKQIHLHAGQRRPVLAREKINRQVPSKRKTKPYSNGKQPT